MPSHTFKGNLGWPFFHNRRFAARDPVGFLIPRKHTKSTLSGPEHAECAEVCIRSGEPSGIKAQNGKVYLLTGKPGQSINAELAEYAAQVVTIRGKKSVRDGFAQLQVEEIRKL